MAKGLVRVQKIPPESSRHRVFSVTVVVFRVRRPTDQKGENVASMRLNEECVSIRWKRWHNVSVSIQTLSFCVTYSPREGSVPVRTNGYNL